MNQKVYPEWVQAHKTKGTTVKKVGDNYYLYKHTSKRVAGKKYPQPVDTYIGVITPDGIIESGKKKMKLSGIEVKEYGYSKAVWSLCPEDWKRPLGEDWEDVLSIIIVEQSPYSYLKRERRIRKKEEFRYQFPVQLASLGKRISNAHKISLKELHILESIYLVYLEKETTVSVINDEQKQLIDRLGIDMRIR
ncbi:MAG: hypothetical protein LUI87_17330 [Lachnospiraceae bacterium]|nr:hypothetical protein [Lachnospiraceae bacterium]